jgi:hypothetical protein
VTITTAATYLTNADRMLSTGAAGHAWPLAATWLLRLALEAALDDFWQHVEPSVTECRSRRAQILLLGGYAGPAVARRVGYLWWALSRAGHHHGYGLALTVGELRHLYGEVKAVMETIGDSTAR